MRQFLYHSGMSIASAVVFIVFLLNNICYGQAGAGSASIYETLSIVDMPTAGVLAKNSYSVNMSMFSNGGFLVGFLIAPLSNVNLGISYSATGLIGADNITFQNLPGFLLNWRILDETKSSPAILIGVNTQGRGMYLTSKKRFITYSPGIYAAISKSFKWELGVFAWHGGINYTFEQTAGTKTASLWLGFEHSIGPDGGIYFEFNPNFADKDRTIASHSPLFNGGLRWSVSRGITIELLVRDMFEYSLLNQGFERWFGISFNRHF